MMQDIKRLLFFQRGKTLFSLFMMAFTLYFVAPFNTGYHFDFLSHSQVAKKVTHVKEMNKDVFVMGRSKNGLQVVGLKQSTIFTQSLLEQIHDNELVVTGSKRFSGVRKVKLSGQDFNAYFTSKCYGKKMIAFTSFARANEILDNKTYFVTSHGVNAVGFLTQMIAFLFLLVFSAYFVFLKSSVIDSLNSFGITNIKFWFLYLAMSLVLSISSSFILIGLKFCLISVLFFTWHVIFKKVFFSKNKRELVFE